MAELTGAEQVVGERLEKIGASLVKNYCTGDSAYPTEYIIRYKDIQVLEPTLDLAFVALVAKLGENYVIPQSYEEIETELQELKEEEMRLADELRNAKQASEIASKSD